MKWSVYLVITSLCLFSCNAGRVRVLDKAYFGMTQTEYAKIFSSEYQLSATSSRVNGVLQPAFRDGRLSSLSFLVKDISDFDTAYTVYELANDFSNKYGLPAENKETVWAGGTSKYFRWKQGQLEIEYSYTYNQVAGTSGLLYTGEARLAYHAKEL